MNLVPAAIGRTLARNSLLLQKSSPTILLGVGIVGMVGSTVLACRATLKMSEVLDEGKKKLDTARTLEHQEYSEKDRRRDISLIHFQTGVKVGRQYAPAVFVGVVSIAAITRSHYILSQRNTALAAAYAAIDKGFREYRARVVSKYGEDQDREFRYGSELVQITDPENDKKKLTVREYPNSPSVYARFFDSNSLNWSKEPEYNMLFLHCQQQWANDRLIARGHIFLNEVYDCLGLERSTAGAVVGWVTSRNGETDNFVNFGVFDGRTEIARDFVNGYEHSILLDFNVDGVIYDKIEEGDMKWRRSS